jgi:hypothetical protein
MNSLYKNRNINRNFTKLQLKTYKEFRHQKHVFNHNVTSFVQKRKKALPIFVCNVCIDMHVSNKNMLNYDYGAFIYEHISMIFIVSMIDTLYKINNSSDDDMLS